MGKLVDGYIPAYTPCPYKEKCEIAQANKCRHTGEEHSVPFSCAIARGFQICEKYDVEEG